MTDILGRISKYELLAHLGTGSFASVYRAQDTVLQRLVALKVLKPALIADEVAFGRFVREAQVTASLFHPHIATALDMGDADGRYFLVMRFVDGESLAERLKRGPLVWDEARRVVTEIASALDFAHSRGLVHRDVKPANIILSSTEGAVLTDFGLVKAMESTGLSSSGNTMLGTPPYMAPELWRGQAATPTSDVYALACVVSEMITGQILFAGETPPEVMTKHVLDGPKLPDHWPTNAPGGLTTELLKALAMQPASRPASAGAFARGLPEPSDAAQKQAEEARQRVEQEQLAAKKVEHERLAREKDDAERLVSQKAQAARLAQEKAEQERLTREKAQAEQMATRKAEAERLARENEEQERLARERAKRERLTQERAAGAKRLEAQKAVTNLAAQNEKERRIPEAQVPLPKGGISRRRFLQLGALFGCSLATASTLGIAGLIRLGNLPSGSDTPTPEKLKSSTKAPTEVPTAAPPTEMGAPTDAPTAIPTAAPVQGNVVVMYRRGELSEDEEAQFESANPGITMDVLQDDFARFFAMYAAGNPPDLLRVQAPSVPQFLARKILYDLTPYFEVSTVLKPDDLGPANNYYKANSPLDIGEGKLYGMPKDWSPDFSIWIYKPTFEAAGIDAPGDETPLSYDEIAQLSAEVAVFEGDRIATWGYGYSDGWSDRIWMNMLAEKGQSLYADSFTKINLTGNDEVKKIIQWYFDMAKNNFVANPVNPSPSWNGEDFTKGTLAMVQWGYWFSGMAESDITKGNIAMIPGPTWAGVRRNPTMTGTGTIMSASTDVADAAWKVFEWYHGLEPSVTRAKSGWGVPALKSQYSLMPTEGSFRQQVAKVLNDELPYTENTLQFNPFLGESTVSDSWLKNLDQALRGSITFDDLLRNIEDEVNQAIKDGIDQL